VAKKVPRTSGRAQAAPEWIPGLPGQVRWSELPQQRPSARFACVSRLYVQSFTPYPFPHPPALAGGWGTFFV